MSGELTDYIARAYRLFYADPGPAMSYNEIMGLTEAAHRHAQYHEIPFRDAVELSRVLSGDELPCIDRACLSMDHGAPGETRTHDL